MLKRGFCRLLIFAAYIALSVSAATGGDATGPGIQGFELVRETAEPTIGKPVTVGVRALEGFPSHTLIKWTLIANGGPVENAVYDANHPTEYSFTPMGPGTFQLLAEIIDMSGDPRTVASVPMVIRIGGPGGSPEQPSGPITLSLLPFNEEPPRVGFMLDYGEGSPPGDRMTEWIVSGGRIDDAKVSGAHKDVYSFIPGAPGDYSITARLYDAEHNLLDEVTEVFSLED